MPDWFACSIVVMMSVMSLIRPPGVFISMTMAVAPEDLAVARAFAIRLDDPGSTGTLKSTTRVLPWPGVALARRATDASRTTEKATASAARRAGRLPLWP